MSHPNKIHEFSIQVKICFDFNIQRFLNCTNFPVRILYFDMRSALTFLFNLIATTVGCFPGYGWRRVANRLTRYRHTAPLLLAIRRPNQIFFVVFTCNHSEPIQTYLHEIKQNIYVVFGRETENQKCCLLT
jgi:hypothetical protein